MNVYITLIIPILMEVDQHILSPGQTEKEGGGGPEKIPPCNIIYVNAITILFSLCKV